MTARKPKAGAKRQLSKTPPSAPKRKPGAQKGNTNFIPFPKGNQLWQMRSRHNGMALIQGGPEELLDACLEYIKWNDETPLWEMKAFAHQGIVVQEPVAKMRAMTVVALCAFIGINNDTWHDWRKNREDLKPTIKYIESIIYAQKFEGASADLLNASIIARELGLADKREVSGPDGGAIRMISTDMTAQEAAEAYAATLNANES